MLLLSVLNFFMATELIFTPHPKKTENPLESIHRSIAFDVRDWAEDRRSAWMYGIVCGWDNKCYDELKKKFNWEDEEIERNKRLHEQFNDLWIYFQENTTTN